MAPKAKAPEVAEDYKIAIPRCERRPLTVVLKGVTPLMTDRIPPWVLEDILRKQAGMSPIPREKRAPPTIFEEAKYVTDTEKGTCGFPTTGIMKAIARAAQRYTKRTLKEMYGLISVPDGLFEIEAEPPVSVTMSARNKVGQVVPVVRPLWMPWRITVDFYYMMPFITDEEAVSLFMMAGEMIGLGAFRKENGGPYGRFEIEEVR